MKSLFFFNILIVITACATYERGNHSLGKLEIIKIDSVADFFVFKTTTDSNKVVIVLAEKDKVNNCFPFKPFIIADSVHETSMLKAGSKYDLIGFNGFVIDGIKLKNQGELAKIIWNCNCFTVK